MVDDSLNDARKQSRDRADSIEMKQIIINGLYTSEENAEVPNWAIG